MEGEKTGIRTVSSREDRLGDYVGPINALLRELSKDKPEPYQITLADLEAALDAKNFTLCVLEIDGEIVGMGSLCFHRTLTKRAAYIEDVVFLPEFQGMGLGKKIVQHLIDFARKEGARFIELTSHPRRVRANKLYRRLGFVTPETNLYRLFF